MLVLNRYEGQEIIIDGRITVTVTRIRGDRVRLGFTAPDNVTIDRAEVHAAKTAETFAQCKHPQSCSNPGATSEDQSTASESQNENEIVKALTRVPVEGRNRPE